jgi:hypothetical protein
MRRRIAVLLPVAAAAAAVAFLLRKLRGSGGTEADFAPASREPRPDAGAPPSDTPATESVEHTYTCDGCQAEYRVSGEGRHTVYWKSDSSISDPVIDGKCVECGKALPGHHPGEGGGEGEGEGEGRDGGDSAVADADADAGAEDDAQAVAGGDSSAEAPAEDA